LTASDFVTKAVGIVTGSLKFKAESLKHAGRGSSVVTRRLRIEY